MNQEFERKITFSPAFDRKNEGYGIGSVIMTFSLAKDRKVVTFQTMTGWYLPNSTSGSTSGCKIVGMHAPVADILAENLLPSDLGYHSLTPLYDWQDKPSHEHCEYTGGVCYSDGSWLNAYPIFGTLVREGSEGVWRELEQYWKETFEETNDV